MKNIETKKILFLLHLPPPVHGSSMVGSFIAQSTLINSSYQTTYLNLLASKSVSETGKVSIAKLWSFVFLFFKLLKRLSQQKPDLCYLALTSTGVAFYRDVVLVALLKAFRIPIIYHLHNKGIAKASQYKINALLYTFVFKRAKVILLSQHLYKDIKSFVLPEDIFICPNGIPDLNIKLNYSKNVPQEVPVILFLSNLIESKGVIVLLNALANLKKENIKFKSIFIGGEGDIKTTMFQHKVKELELDQSVEYVGKKYGLEKEKYLQEASIFVFPTHYTNECFPLVLLEAMQFALPVISTFEGGIQDIVDNNVTGFLVNQKNTVELTEKLKILINCNPIERIRMGQKGRKKYEKYFTIELFENTLNSILLNVLKSVI